MVDLEDVLPTAALWLAEEGRVALATVVETWGSSPRQPGSRMVLAPSGRMAGSVSGGCIEAAVAEAAWEVLEDAAPRMLSFGVSDAQAWEVGLACGGQVRVLVERVAADDGRIAAP